MKLQLDTTNKTIKVDGNVKLSELIETLDKILPGLWKNFTLEPNTTIIEWTKPINIDKPYTPYWYKLEKYPEITCKNDNIMLCEGKFNIEC